tara:strand:- start:421 stop:723 length:303 start_codon:yes stop_codon:yes gene_type:complete
MTVKFKKNLGKKEIVSNINNVLGLSSKNIQKIIEDLIEILKDTLVNQNKVSIKNFGTFIIIHKKSRIGRNPKTNQKFNIVARNIVKFKASTFLKRKINEI